MSQSCLRSNASNQNVHRHLVRFYRQKWLEKRMCRRDCRTRRHPVRFNRSALNTTDAELRLIASAAIIGDSSQPVSG